MKDRKGLLLELQRNILRLRLIFRNFKTFPECPQGFPNLSDSMIIFIFLSFSLSWKGEMILNFTPTGRWE